MAAAVDRQVKVYDSKRGRWVESPRTLRKGRDWIIVVETRKRRTCGKSYSVFMPKDANKLGLPRRFRSMKNMREYRWPSSDGHVQASSKKRRKKSKSTKKNLEATSKKKEPGADVMKRSATISTSTQSSSETVCKAGKFVQQSAYFGKELYGGWLPSTSGVHNTLHTCEKEGMKGRMLSASEKRNVVVGLSKVVTPFTNEFRCLCTELNIPIRDDGMLHLDLNTMEFEKVIKLQAFVTRKLRKLRQNIDMSSLNDLVRLQDSARFEAQGNKVANAKLLNRLRAIEKWEASQFDAATYFPEGYSPEQVHVRATVSDILVFDESGHTEDKDWDPFCIKGYAWKRS